MARHRNVVRRPQIGKLGKQIDVGLNSVLGHLPVCEDRQKSIARVVGECPSIGWKGRGPGRIIGHHLWQKRRCDPCGLIRRIPTRMLQSVREPGNETGVVYRFTCQVGVSFRADQKDSCAGSAPRSA